MAALGDRPAREVTTREIGDLLKTIAARRRGPRGSERVAPRTVNKARQLICAIFSFGMRQSTYALPLKPAVHADRRAERQPGPLAYYSPEQIERLAAALAAGQHRDRSRPATQPGETEARAAEDAQDGEIVRLAAYAGLRPGELVALRWRDVDFVGRKLTVRRAVSGDTEVASTKSQRARQVPMPDHPPVGDQADLAQRVQAPVGDRPISARRARTRGPTSARDRDRRPGSRLPPSLRRFGIGRR
jgi:integrase